MGASWSSGALPASSPETLRGFVGEVSVASGRAGAGGLPYPAVQYVKPKGQLLAARRVRLDRSWEPHRERSAGEVEAIASTGDERWWSKVEIWCIIPGSALPWSLGGAAQGLEEEPQHAQNKYSHVKNGLGKRLADWSPH